MAEAGRSKSAARDEITDNLRISVFAPEVPGDSNTVFSRMYVERVGATLFPNVRAHNRKRYAEDYAPHRC